MRSFSACRAAAAAAGAAAAAAAVAVALAAAAGCGHGEPAGTDAGGTPTDAASASGRFLPLAVGAAWSWQVTDALGVMWTKDATVEAYEPAPGSGAMSYRIRTTDASEVELSWQEDTGTAVRRLAEDLTDLVTGAPLHDYLYLPHKMRLDEDPVHLVASATWIDSYDETDTDYSIGMTATTTKMYRWTVEAESEAVTVPAGTFDCLRVHRVGLATAYDKTFFFARGVGKVKEIGGTTPTEELVAYTMP